MARGLAITLGHYSDKGRKNENQDFHGALIPVEPLLTSKGIAIAIADGISSSRVSAIASESAVKSFLTDYYCTPDSWSVKTSAQRVISVTNSWLHAQTRRSQYRYDLDQGYVCTFTALVIKAASSHLFHVGDCRVYKIAKSIELLTDDHRILVSAEKSYLSRALGIEPHIEIDYRTIAIEPGDVFLLATDGIYDYLRHDSIEHVLANCDRDLDAAARRLADIALQAGSPDNLTIQLVRVDDVAEPRLYPEIAEIATLPLPSLFEPGIEFEGYRIIWEIHASARSHVYLAVDIETSEQAAIKIPSIELRNDPDKLKQFIMEEWIGRRINNAHVMKIRPRSFARRSLSIISDYIEGQTLSQWMRDHPTPHLETVRTIIEQIASGLRAFHRMEMVHQDLRPQNIMIGPNLAVKLIDFGSTKVSGVSEALSIANEGAILGTFQYTAPEYFLGDIGTARSDGFSLGVIAYEMLTGQLPYGTEVSRARTLAGNKRLAYRSARLANPRVPEWVDHVLRKAVHRDPHQRYGALSEFTHDLRFPKERYDGIQTPLIERNPLLFWKMLSLVLVLLVVVLSAALHFQTK